MGIGRLVIPADGAGRSDGLKLRYLGVTQQYPCPDLSIRRQRNTHCRQLIDTDIGFLIRRVEHIEDARGHQHRRRLAGPRQPQGELCVAGACQEGIPGNPRDSRAGVEQ
jgi:hypothetical protein